MALKAAAITTRVWDAPARTMSETNQDVLR
jgi:hypothetical protein